jgi:hypothetical protein
MLDRNRLLAHGASRIPWLKRIPIFKLLAIAEVAMLAQQHFSRLDSQERSRLFELLQTSRGRTGNLTQREREELAALTAKMEPRLFAGLVAHKLSPVPLPKRFVHGRAQPAARQDERTAA